MGVATMDAEGKEFTITVEGRSQSDIESALEECLRAIRNGFLAGGDRNNTGSYEFDSTGEYVPCEVQCNECGFFGTWAEFLGNRKSGAKAKPICPDCNSKSCEEMEPEEIEA